MRLYVFFTVDTNHSSPLYLRNNLSGGPQSSLSSSTLWIKTMNDQHTWTNSMNWVIRLKSTHFTRYYDWNVLSSFNVYTDQLLSVNYLSTTRVFISFTSKFTIDQINNWVTVRQNGQYYYPNKEYARGTFNNRYGIKFQSLMRRVDSLTHVCMWTRTWPTLLKMYFSSVNFKNNHGMTLLSFKDGTSI